MQRGVATAVEQFLVESGDKQALYRVLEPDPPIEDPAQAGAQAGCTHGDWGLLAHWSVQGHSKVAGALVGVIEVPTHVTVVCCSTCIHE